MPSKNSKKLASTRLTSQKEEKLVSLYDKRQPLLTSSTVYHKPKPEAVVKERGRRPSSPTLLDNEPQTSAETNNDQQNDNEIDIDPDGDQLDNEEEEEQDYEEEEEESQCEDNSNSNVEDNSNSNVEDNSNTNDGGGDGMSDQNKAKFLALRRQLHMLQQKLENKEEDNKKKRRRSKSLSEVLEASTSSSSLNESGSPLVVECSLTYEEATKFCTSQEHFVEPCKLCGAANNKHMRASNTFRMPFMKEFPVFRDPSDSQMNDPRLFFNKLERALIFHSVPDNKWRRVVVSCVHDDLMQQWIEENLIPVDKCKTWQDFVKAFSNRYTDPSLTNKYIMELDSLRQRQNERVHTYGEKYTSLMSRLNYGLDNSAHVYAFERGFVPEIRKELAKIKAQRTGTGVGNKSYEFATIPEVIQAAQAVETALQPAQGRYSSDKDGTSQHSSHKNKKNKNNKSSHINKLEFGSDGVPQNVNKKHKNKSRGGSSRGGSSRGDGRDQVVNDKSHNHNRGKTRGGRGGRGKSDRSGQKDDESASSSDGEDGCYVCGGNHLSRNCFKRFKKGKRTNNVGFSSTDRAIHVRACELRRHLSVSSPLIPDAHAVLVDTGAEFSAISHTLVHKHRLHVFPPRKGETKYITLADKSKHVARIGSVVIPVKIHFNGGKPRQPFECRMRCEVLNMSYDFILGVDIIPLLFPDDDILDFLIRPAPTTSDSVVVDEETEIPKIILGKQMLKFGMEEKVKKCDSDDCVDDYISERVSEMMNTRIHTMFDDDLSDLFSQLSVSSPAANVSAASVSSATVSGKTSQ
jgi:hypothetical protein